MHDDTHYSVIFYKSSYSLMGFFFTLVINEEQKKHFLLLAAFLSLIPRLFKDVYHFMSLFHVSYINDYKRIIAGK